jgi:predicted dehydrogenase
MPDRRDKIRWGILGTGRMAAAFARCLKEVEDAELVAVGSRTSESAAAFAARHSARNAHVGYAPVADDAEVDVVYVATPHSLHRENTLMSLHAGKAVLCEKPFAINAAQAASMIDAARARGLFLMEAMWTRFVPAVVRFRELLAEGAIGDVQLMVAGGAYQPAPDPDFYLFRRELGGGVLLDAGVYLVSMASMIFGPPSSVAAVGTLAPQGIDEQEGILLEHEAGGIATLYVSLRAQSAPDLTILGSAGRIYAHPPIFAPRRLTLTRYDGEDEILELPFAAEGYQFQAEEVGACLRAGRLQSQVMPLDETLQIMQTMDAIRDQLGLRYPME